MPQNLAQKPCYFSNFKGELHSNYIIMISLFCLNWSRMGFYKSIYKIELFFLPKLTFQHHLHKTVLGQLPPPPRAIAPRIIAPRQWPPRKIVLGQLAPG